GAEDVDLPADLLGEAAISSRRQREVGIGFLGLGGCLDNRGLGLASGVAGGRLAHSGWPRTTAKVGTGLAGWQAPESQAIKTLKNRDGEVAEWQTRRTQNPVHASGCGFKSHLRQ